MYVTIKGATKHLIPPDAVRVGEETVQRLVRDVGVKLERIHDEIVTGGIHTKNDGGGYYQTVHIATGDVFVFGSLEITSGGCAIFEVEVMKREREATVFLGKECF